jgi:hypothetical protein
MISNETGVTYFFLGRSAPLHFTSKINNKLKSKISLYRTTAKSQSSPPCGGTAPLILNLQE